MSKDLPGQATFMLFMNFKAKHLPYGQTGYFSKIITDYIETAPALKPFYAHPVSREGILSAIHSREQFATNRSILVEALKKQYSVVETVPAVSQNIERLEKDHVFTITTAHQPAIFTGHLYFIYKILHVIRLAEQLRLDFPEYDFVPVYYMGNEDADLEELGSIFLDQEKISWDTHQTGAVGKMNTKGLDKIISRIEGEFSTQPFGKDLVALLRECYDGSASVELATFRLVHHLFAEYGLVVLIPDAAELKKQMLPVFDDDLFLQTPSELVEKSNAALSDHYKVQANPRAINLFYLVEGVRERIVASGADFVVPGTSIRFSKETLREELDQHPGRFSPNVILRGLYQETILPNIVFVGGGGETAYWLELKILMDHYKIPFPVLVLRNSFLIVEKKWKEKISKTGFSSEEYFRSEESLVNEIVKKESRQQLALTKELTEAASFYKQLASTTGAVDPTLAQHVAALEAKSIRPLLELEKKMLRAEKRKFKDQRAQVASVRAALFPFNGLQERIENFIPYYAKWGRAWLKMLHDHSLATETFFTILEEE